MTNRRSRGGLRWAFDRLLSGYASAESLGGLMMELRQAHGPEVKDFLRQVIAECPHPQVRGLGCTALGLALQLDPRIAGETKMRVLLPWNGP